MENNLAPPSWWSCVLVGLLCALLLVAIHRCGGSKSGFAVSPRARHLANLAEGYFGSTAEPSFKQFKKVVKDGDAAQYDRLRSLYRNGNLGPVTVQEVLDRRRQ